MTMAERAWYDGVRFCELPTEGSSDACEEWRLPRGCAAWCEWCKCMDPVGVDGIANPVAVAVAVESPPRRRSSERRACSPASASTPLSCAISCTARLASTSGSSGGGALGADVMRCRGSVATTHAPGHLARRRAVHRTSAEHDAISPGRRRGGRADGASRGHNEAEDCGEHRVEDEGAADETTDGGECFTEDEAEVWLPGEDWDRCDRRDKNSRIVVASDATHSSFPNSAADRSRRTSPPLRDPAVLAQDPTASGDLLKNSAAVAKSLFLGAWPSADNERRLPVRGRAVASLEAACV
jgi:hypothetical protein